MTDKTRLLIHIPREENYIELLGYRIDGYDSLEAFLKELNKYAELKEENERLKAENERLKGILNTDFCVLGKRAGKVKAATELFKIRVDAIKAEGIKEFQDRIVEQLEREDVPDTNVGKWIPCSERLPEELHMSLVTLENREVCLGVYRPESNEWLTRMCEGEIYYTTSHKVIAWQLLPEPYKGE